MGPFSFTGQPNAMGGREVGGMANTLAAHLELENPQHRRTGAEFLEQPAHRHHGPASRRLTSSRPCTPVRSRPCGSWARTRWSACRMRIAFAQPWHAASWSSYLTVSRRPTRPPTPMCCFQPPAGVRKTARSPTPSAGSRGSALFSTSPARPGLTGGSCVKSPGAWASSFHFRHAVRYFLRACAAVRDGERRHASLRYLRSVDIDRIRVRKPAADPVAGERSLRQRGPAVV